MNWRDPIFLAAALPFAVALAGYLLLGRPWRKHRGGWTEAASALVLAVAFATAQVVVFDWPALPPADATHWLAWLGGLAAVLAIGEARLGLPALVAHPLRLALGALTTWLLLKPLSPHEIAYEDLPYWVAATGFYVYLLHSQSRALDRRNPGASLPMLWAMLGGAAGGILLMSHTASFGQLAGALGAAAGPAVVLAWLRPQASLLGPASGVASVIFCGTILVGYFYVDMPLPRTLLLLAAPFAPWLIEWGPGSRLSGWKATAVRILLAAIPTAIALYLAWESYQLVEDNPYGGY